MTPIDPTMLDEAVDSLRKLEESLRGGPHDGVIVVAVQSIARLRLLLNGSGAVPANGKPVRGDVEGPPRAVRDTKWQVARDSGYTGNECGNCHGVRMIRDGTCERCLDCGTGSRSCS